MLATGLRLRRGSGLWHRRFGFIDGRGIREGMVDMLANEVGYCGRGNVVDKGEGRE